MSYPRPRHAWWIVARNEIMVKLTSKGFWISTATTLGIMIIAFGASALFSSGLSTTQVGVTDDATAAVVELANESGGEYEVTVLPEAELEQAITDDEVDVGLLQTEAGWEILVTDVQDQPRLLSTTISSYQLQLNLAEQGLDPAEVLAGTTPEVVLIGDQDGTTQTLIMITSLVFSVLFFMAALTYGLQIAQSVVEEKESRIVEILASAIPTQQLLTGKVVGNSIMAIGQLVLYLAVGVVGVSLTQWSDFLPMLAPYIGWFVVFFLFGFAALACLWAAAGAMATRVADVGNTTMPLMLLLTGAYVAGFLATGTTATVLSYVPVVSSIVMPNRLLAGEANWIGAVISLLIVAVFMAIAIRIGSAIYRRGIMKTSGMMKLSEALGKE